MRAADSRRAVRRRQRRMAPVTCKSECSSLWVGRNRGISPTVREGSALIQPGALPNGRANAPLRRSIANCNYRRSRFQAIAVIITILRLCDSGDAEAENLEYFTIRADRVAPPGVVVIGIVGSRLQPRDRLFSLQHRR